MIFEIFKQLPLKSLPKKRKSILEAFHLAEHMVQVS